ncbi:MAG TPA: glycosyltransferase, partial [Chroococcales cyanobacterium]
LQRITESLWVLTPPPFFPINFLPEGKAYSFFLGRQAALTARAIRAAMRRLELSDPIFWISFDVPLGEALIGKFEEKMRIYHRFDEIRGQPYLARHGGPREKKLIESCDLVFSSSPALMGGEEKFFFLPNGVEHAFFARALEEIEVPPDLAAIPRPRIGFLGNIEERMNRDLLKRILQERPSWSLVLIGPAKDPRAMEAFSKFSNFHWLGSRKYSLAPNYLGGFDVGIIPYVRSLQTSGIYPLKINEYLAAGLPVVLTDFAPLEEFRRVAEISPESGFIEAVERALLKDSREERRRRSLFALSNSWERRAERVSERIEFSEGKR